MWHRLTRGASAGRLSRFPGALRAASGIGLGSPGSSGSSGSPVWHRACIAVEFLERLWC